MPSADMAIVSRVRRVAVRAVAEFFDDGCPQRAAAISYYSLLSLFPLAIVVVAGLGLVLDDEEARGRVVDFVLRNVPLDAGEGRRDLERLLEEVTSGAGTVGIFGLVGLVITASAVMGAIRQALNAAWDVEDPRPFAQGKAIDLLLVLGFGAAVAASFALTLGLRLTASLSEATNQLLAWTAQLVPVMLALAIFLVLFAVVPACTTRIRDTWPGALVAALGYEAAKTGFSVYLESFGRYDVVYASLGSVVAFLVFVFIAANVLLLGAEVAAEWPRVRDHRDEPAAAGAPRGRRLVAFVRGLFVRPR
jgi:membrane protein